MRLRKPLLIYSRLDLNRMLLDRAERGRRADRKGARPRLERVRRGWRVRTQIRRYSTPTTSWSATGARNPLRNVGTEWTAADTMCALGYYVPGEREHIDIQFFPNFEGYIWVFPRCGHLSVGICGKGESAQRALRERLERYMERERVSRCEGRARSTATCSRRWNGPPGTATA